MPPADSSSTSTRSSTAGSDRAIPASSIELFEIEIIDPDTLLLDQLDLAPAAVTDEFSRQPSTTEGPA